jgi:hypothetical protein
MDQLFSLGHISGATKILEVAPRGMSSDWFSEEERAGLRPDTFESDPAYVRLDKPSG